MTLEFAFSRFSFLVIDLEMSYVNNVFRLQHKMFVMMGTDAASYKVTCSIKLCEKDDVDSECRKVYRVTQVLGERQRF